MPCREVRSMLLSWLFPYRQKDGFLVQIKESNQHTLVFSRQRIDQIIFAYPIGFANLTLIRFRFTARLNFFWEHSPR